MEPLLSAPAGNSEFFETLILNGPIYCNSDSLSLLQSIFLENAPKFWELAIFDMVLLMQTLLHLPLATTTTLNLWESYFKSKEISTLLSQCLSIVCFLAGLEEPRKLQKNTVLLRSLV